MNYLDPHLGPSCAQKILAMKKGEILMLNESTSLCFSIVYANLGLWGGRGRWGTGLYEGETPEAVEPGEWSWSLRGRWEVAMCQQAKWSSRNRVLYHYRCLRWHICFLKWGSLQLGKKAFQLDNDILQRLCVMCSRVPFHSYFVSNWSYHLFPKFIDIS